MRVVGAAANGTLALAVALAPPVFFCLWAWPQLLGRVDRELAEAKPLIEHEVSAALERPVRFARLSPDLSLATIQKALAQETLPVELTGLELGSRPRERPWLGQPWLARVPRVRASLSLAAVREGKLEERGVREVILDAPEAVVFRRPDGRLSVLDFLPRPKTAPDPKATPFQTTVTVHSARVRFRDFASPLAPGRLEENAVERVEATAELTGTRTVRFVARAFPAGRTRLRIGAPLFVEGSVRRSEPTPRPDSPRPDQPLWSVHAQVRDVDLAYALRYTTTTLPELALTRGRASIEAWAIQPAAPGTLPLLRASARFGGVDLQLRKPVPIPFTQLAGSATYDSQTLRAVVGGRALGEAFVATGKLEEPLGRTPTLAATVKMERVPLRKGLALLPQIKLPRELTLGETLTLEGARVSGPLTALEGTARISGITGRWEGLPPVRASASVAFTPQSVTATEIRANLAGGGVLTGQGSFALKSQLGTFEAHLRGAPLESVTLLKNLRTPPRGRLAADVQGTIQRETLRGEGVVQTTNLAVAGLSFPAASARLTLRGKQFQLQDGVLAGSSGALRISGTGTLGGQLALEGHLVGAELGQLTEAFGLPGVGGTVSASLALTGTQEAPTLLLRDVTVLQPRYRFEDHLLVADSAHLERGTLRLFSTGQVRLELDPMQPLRVSHSPAVALVHGTVTGTKDSARLNLIATAENLEVDEILRQLSDEPGRFAPMWLQKDLGYQELLELLEWTGVPKPPISGFVRSARATLSGDAKDPQIEGEATLGRFLVANYPLEGGTLAFSRNSERLRVHTIQLATATGTVQGELGMTTEGILSGNLTAPSLDLDALSSLSGLVEKQLGITGALSANLTLAGTAERPLVTVALAEARPIQIAGIPLKELTIAPIVVAPILEKDTPLQGTITLPVAALKLGADAAKITLTEARYDLATERLTSSFGLTEAHLKRVISLLKSAYLDETPEGKDFLSALYKIPEGIDGTASLTGTLGFHVASTGLEDLTGAFRLRSTDLTFAGPQLPEPVQGQLNARASLAGERLTLESAELTVLDPRSEDPAIARLLPHQLKDSKTGETTTTKSWLRLPQTKDEKLEYHLTLDTNGLPLQLVRTLFPKLLTLPIQGKAALTVAADGTPEIPHLTASFYADNLLLGSTIGVAGEANTPPFPVDLIRFQVEIAAKDEKDWQILVSDGRLAHAKEILTFEGNVPYDNKNERVAADQPLSLRAAIDDASGITLSTLGQYLQTGGTKLEGVLRGNVQLAGSLNEPRLAGQLRLENGTARFPNPLQRGVRDVINPVQKLELAVDLAGREIRFPKAELQMAQLPTLRTEKGKPLPAFPPLASLPSAGKLTLEPGSLIRIENLEDFTRLFVRKDTTTAPKLRGEFDLKARFENFQVDADNATALLMDRTLIQSLGGGLEEAFKGQISGRFQVTGPLIAPTLASPANAPLALSELSFRVPKRQLPEISTKVDRFFNPRFALALETKNQARLTKPGIFEFSGLGEVTISGDLEAPKIEGLLSPTGGYFKYPLAPFTVQRGGELRLTYAKRLEAGQDRLQFDLRAQDVVATGKVQVSASNVRASRATPTTFDPSRMSNQIPEELAGRRVTVTASFNGLLPFGDTVLSVGKTQASPIRFTSDPPLSEYAILSLLFPLQALSGLSEQALRDGAVALGTGLSSSLLTPLTSQFERLFGLENVSLDYGLDGMANLFFVRRLPEPFDKITIEVRRSFQTRSSSSALLPQFYSINYEIGQLRKGSRLQLGASTNEQRDNQLFIRGALRY